MAEKNKEEDKNTETPVCEKCGNLMIEESDAHYAGEIFDSELEKPRKASGSNDRAVWVCPHCQGEIDFLAGDEDD